MPYDSKILVAGPCSAENEKQVFESAQALASLHPIFRAGVWKPRTSPLSFQGAGKEALVWLKRVKQELHMDIATEVATAEHIHLALEAGVDYLWIGARTAANPIQVQELADTLRHSAIVPKGVFIKNPVNEDVGLWQGDIERLQQAGMHVMAIHRGCNHRPCWAMSFELRRRMPQLVMLLDPSHMSGDASMVPTLCQQAMDLNYDGLMVESHLHPSDALSDAHQQITPAQLADIITHLEMRHPSTPDTELLALRQQIDETDDELWQLIAHRMTISKAIGQYKKEHQLPILQTDRYDAILRKRIDWAQSKGLSEELVRAVFEIIHKESVEAQL